MKSGYYILVLHIICVHMKFGFLHRKLLIVLVFLWKTMFPKAIGVGSIMINLFDETIRALKNVTDVPKLKISLISWDF